MIISDDLLYSTSPTHGVSIHSPDVQEVNYDYCILLR